jgi:hypothetical protein
VSHEIFLVLSLHSSPSLVSLVSFNVRNEDLEREKGRERDGEVNEKEEEGRGGSPGGPGRRLR